MALESLQRSVTRRQLLKLSALTVGWVSLARLGLPATPLGAQWRGAYRLQVLKPHDAAVLVAVMERMVRGDDDALPPVKKTHAVETVDWALTFASPDLQTQARWLLRIFNWSPLWVLWKPGCFVNLTVAQQDECLQRWSDSSLGWVRAGFLALKNLSVLGYYSQDETWSVLHYRGPWIPRPRRVGWAIEQGGEQ